MCSAVRSRNISGTAVMYAGSGRGLRHWARLPTLEINANGRFVGDQYDSINILQAVFDLGEVVTAGFAAVWAWNSARKDTLNRMFSIT